MVTCLFIFFNLPATRQVPAKLAVMAQEKEFYSKVCVAGSIKFVVGEASKEDFDLSESDKFSCNLATILARDEEVVAVRLTTLFDSCTIYISKNGNWIEKDDEYIRKTRNT